MIPCLPRCASSSSLQIESPHLRAGEQAGPSTTATAAKSDRVELVHPLRAGGDVEPWVRAGAELYLDTASLQLGAAVRRRAPAEEPPRGFALDGPYEHATPADIEELVARASPQTLRRLLDERHARPLSPRVIRAVRERLTEHRRQARQFAVLLERAPPPLAERSARERLLHEADVRRVRDEATQRELRRSVAAATNSPDPAVRFEGETARHVMNAGGALVRFNHVLEDPRAANRRRGEVDVETPDAIIECTTGKSRSRKVGQITRTLQHPECNPAGKPVILRADYVSPHLERELHDHGATVARTPGSLERQLDLLKRIRLGQFAGPSSAAASLPHDARATYDPVNGAHFSTHASGRET